MRNSYHSDFLAKDALFKERLKELDDKAKKILGLPESILIENASRGILEVIIEQKIKHRSVSIFAGRGNNGADSLALARHLFNRGSSPDIFLVLGDGRHNKEVEFQLQILANIVDPKKIRVLRLQQDLEDLENNLGQKDLVVDGIFGIGFRPPLDSFHKNLFKIINAGSGNILAVDIASGLSADDACIDQEAIKADLTVTFVAAKKGFFVGDGPKYTGKIFVKDIGVSRDVLENL